MLSDANFDRSVIFIVCRTFVFSQSVAFAEALVIFWYFSDTEIRVAIHCYVTLSFLPWFYRYGIRPRHFAEVLTSNDDVNAYVIFIGSLGDQASRCATIHVTQ